MLSSSIARPSQSAPPLVVLAAWLENAHHRDDRVVSFPANTSEAIRQARSLGAQYNMQEVQAIVLALECFDSKVCERLDSLSLTILCSIFIYSQECLAQQRGLYLLAKALHRDKGDSAQKAAHKQGKKMAVGQAALTLLIKRFLKTDASDKLRRWFGILALELLENCPENTEKLQSDPPEEQHWQCLGEVIEHGSCQLLKLLAGSMIREILGFGVPPDDFWPTETGLDIYSNFPKSQQHNSQWVTSFEEFVDELVLRKVLTQEVSSVVFVYAVYVGDRKWNLEEASDILVTVSEELNIIVPGNDANPAVYIDVPLNSILEVSFDTDSQKPTCGLVIQLMGGTASNCIINATGYAERHLALAFASEKDANTLRRLLSLTNVRTNGNPPHSQSGAIVVSRPILSDDELAASGPALSNSQSIMDTASLANAIIPHRNPVNTVNPSMLERVHTFHRASAEHQERSSDSMVEHDEDPQTVGHCVEMAAEGIDVSQDDGLVEQATEGIDVSQADGLSLGETHNGTQAHPPDNASSSVRFRYSQALSGRSQETMGHFDRTSDTGPLGSLQSHMDLNAIQNVPEQQFVSSVEPVENINRLEAQDRGYDDLYDASPKVKDGRRRSPRIIARDSIPPKLERALGSTARQASVKTGTPTKLSRQLRNDNGVLEPHTEQIANDGLATLAKNRAADVKTSANSKKRKPPVPAKVRKELKESTNPTKKTTQGKTKSIATEESPNASFDNYDLPPSPTRARSTIQTSGDKKKTTTARLKATKAPCKNQKQAKLVTTKAAATILPKSPAPRFQKRLKNKAKANGSTQDSVPQKPIGEKVDNDADAIWDVGQAHSKENPQSLRQSRRPTKLVKRQEVRVSKTEKNRAPTQLQSDEAKANKSIKTQTQAPIARVVKAKPAPAALSQPRIRRTAAIKANNRIQGLDESDEIVDDEETVIALTRSSRHASSGRTNAPENQKVRDGRDDRPTSSGKLPTTPYSEKDFVLDSSSPESSDEQRPNLVSEPKANSSLEKVDLVKDAPAEALRAAPGDTRNTLQKKTLTHAAETSQTVTSLDSGHGEHLNQRDPISLKQGVEVSEARVDLVPDSVPQLHESITETRPALTRPKQDADVKQGHNDLDATTPAGPGNQTQAEHVLPCIDDLSHELDSKTDRVEEDVAPSQAPPAPMVVEISQRRTSPRLAEAAQKRLPESIATRRDPFGAKLNSLLVEPNDISAKITSREDSGDINAESEGPNTPSLAGLARSSKEPKVGAFEELEATSVEEAKQIENPRRHLKSLMQVDGEHKDSLSETLELAGESMSTSRVEAKRKFEQLGNTSHKRVKLAHRERLEGVAARRKSAEDAKKTPPPVISNRPLVIGFSTTGPRNQGTISSKAPKPPKGVGTGATSAVELRKYDAPNTTVNQVEAGLISVREALDVPPDHIQQNLKNGSGAPKKARGSPQRKQAEYLTQAHRAQKRKLAPFLDESAPWEHGKLSKRQKRDIVTPPTAHNHHPKMLPDPSPAVVHDRSQRLSSQNTRVNEKGSPMPFWITRREIIAAEEQYSDEDDGKDALAEARLDEQILLHDDDPILPQPVLPLRPLMSAVLISQPKTTAYQSLSNNSKQVPSSPHAPSAFGTMPPHHIYHDGEIVNAETKESIIPIKPQDPFLDATENTQNPFMNALRKSTEVTAKRPVSGANNKRRLGAVVMRLSLDGGEDPEKTLVEPNLRKHKQFLLSDSSSSSQSGSSTQASQPNKSSEEESDAETDIKWRKGLEPYQENTLECLLTISHRLVRHLIDKETAIKDMVTDFASHGKNLIDFYENGLQEYTNSHRVNNDLRYENLANVFKKAQADRATTSKAVVKRRVQDMKAQWETQQEALKETVAAALAACAE